MMITKTRTLLATTALAALLAAPPLAPAPALAQDGEVVVGMSVAPTSLDPQLGALASDESMYRQIYDPLVLSDANLQPIPALAESWELIDDTTWEFKLRDGVSFHDGSAFDAEDVRFTLDRLGTVEGSDGLNAEKMSVIENLEIVDPLTIRVTTSEPVPDFLTRLYTQFIISDELPADVATEAFNSGEAAIGTGPYRMVEWNRGEELILQANESYWDGAPEAKRVVMREIPNDGARVAALLAGDVDVVDSVPPLDVARLEGDSAIDVISGPASRTIFLQFNTVKGADEFGEGMIAAKDGSALADNPLRDERVREAISLAVNQPLIVERIMEGRATVANQMVPEGFGGSVEGLGEPPYDPERARALLEEAGFADGFAMTLGCPNDRYINDAAICQAVGQMLAAIGIDTTVDTMPRSVYFERMRGGDFPFFMLGWGNAQGDSSSVLTSVITTRDEGGGFGSWNGGTADEEIDSMVKSANVIVDPAGRNAGLSEAMALTMERDLVVPLHQQPIIVGTRGGIGYTTIPDEGFRARNLDMPE